LGVVFMKNRKSGILLPIFSLPGKYGIGSFGQSAYDFIDFLQEAGQTYWQILPLGPTGYGDSPYSSCSSYAGNPYFIAIEKLVEDGLLTQAEAAAAERGYIDYVDYGPLYETRFPLLRNAFARGRSIDAAKQRAFAAEHVSWLPDYALYMACKSHFQMKAFPEWNDKALIRRLPTVIEQYRSMLAEDIAFYTYVQYLFFTQWEELRAYAAGKGIAIIGDLPIYAAADSAEVWAQPELFEVTPDGKPVKVAGVPPDLYSETGQLWGNPLYRWSVHEADGFAFWLHRIGHTLRFFDVIRIDHFRGLESYWEIPAGEKNAVKGVWRQGPAMKLMDAIAAQYPKATLIAEDMGLLSEGALAFIQESGLPGMKLLVSAFDPVGESDFLPHNIPRNSVAYTSCHDSPTFVGWLYSISTPEEHAYCVDYLALDESRGAGWDAIRAIWGSPADTAIAAFQDVLGLGSDARINTPSTLGDNWRWRVRAEAFNAEVAEKLYKLTRTFRRLPAKPIEAIDQTYMAAKAGD
jgi:4-alpha-glucanotransferase